MKNHNDSFWGKKTINGNAYTCLKIKYPGMTKEKYLYGKTRAEVKEKQKDYELSQGFLLNKEKNQITLGECLESWMTHIRPYEVEESTYLWNRLTIDYHMKSSIPYSSQISSVTGKMIQQHLSQLPTT